MAYEPHRPGYFNLFNRIRNMTNQQLKKGQKESEEWLENLIKIHANARPQRLMLDKNNLVDETLQGKFYFFWYDPKWAAGLNYYDVFPFILLIDFFDDGRLFGINFHYLPITLRAQLLDYLIHFRSNNKWDETTKVKATYAFLKHFAKHQMVKPTLHSYIPSHVQSKFLQVSIEDAKMAVLLPVSRFKKATNTQVWKDSEAIIAGTQTGTKNWKKKK